MQVSSTHLSPHTFSTKQGLDSNSSHTILMTSTTAISPPPLAALPSGGKASSTATTAPNPPLLHRTLPTDDTGAPIPSTLGELVQLIREELGPHGLMDTHAVNVPRLQRILSNYVSDASEWSQYAHFDKYRYTRNLVDDGNGKYNLLLLCWGDGQASPIHDHAGSHCLMKLLDGELVETRYRWPEGTSTLDGATYSATEACASTESKDDSAPGMLKTLETKLGLNQVAYIHGKRRLHRSQTSVSPLY
jgi:hypothetical protein